MSAWKRSIERVVNRARGQSKASEIGHREYVGGMWEKIGRLQFDFLVAKGLKPHDVLVDVACGSLRAGVHLIPYLDPGHYLGIEKEAELVERGLQEELSPQTQDIRRPEFVISGDFQFERFSRRANWAIAHSLFTHLVPDEILSCLTRLRSWADPRCVLYASFLEAAQPTTNPDRSDPHLPFFYSRSQMSEFGERAGWSVSYLGDWSHPRDQIMVRYQAGNPGAEVQAP